MFFPSSRGDDEFFQSLRDVWLLSSKESIVYFQRGHQNRHALSTAEAPLEGALKLLFDFGERSNLFHEKLLIACFLFYELALSEFTDAERSNNERCSR